MIIYRLYAYERSFPSSHPGNFELDFAKTGKDRWEDVEIVPSDWGIKSWWDWSKGEEADVRPL